MAVIGTASLGAADEPPPAGVVHPVCPGATPSLTQFAQWDSQLENLAFDDTGNLVVVDLHGDRLLLYDPAGHLLAVTDLAASHGITWNAADRHFYATGVLEEMAGPAGVVRFQVADGSFGPMTPYSDGHRVVNGMAFGPDGSLYTSDPLATAPPYLNRIPPGGGPAAPWRDHYGPNGLWPASHGGEAGLLIAITGNQSSPIEFVPFDESVPRAILHTSTLGAATLQPSLYAPHGDAYLAPKGYDDLTVGPDGNLYVTAHVTGEVIRIEPDTGFACAVASGLEEPTSLRFAPASFGPHAGDLFVTDMGGTAVTALVGPGAGAVWRLDTNPGDVTEA